MYIKNWSKYLIAATIVLGCSQQALHAQKKGKKSNETKKVQTNTDNSDQQLLSDIFLDALQAKLLNDTPKATELLKDCLNIDPQNGAVNYELALIFDEAKDYQTALTYAQTASEAAPTNKWYQYVYADLLLYNQQVAQAAKVYERLIQQTPADIDNYNKISYIYRMSGETDKAIKALDQLEQRIGVIEEISADKQRLYLQQNNVEGAAKELEKLIQNYPSELRYYNQLAELYNANKKPEKADEVYARMIKIAPNDPLAQMAMARQYYNKGERAKGATLLKEAFAKPEIEPNEKIDLLMGMLSAQPSKEELVEAEQLTAIIAQTHPKNAQIHAIHGDIFMTLEQKDNAINAFKRTLELDGNLYPVWEQVMFLEYELQKNENLLQTTKEATELFPNQPLPYYFNGLANLQLKDYNKAIKSLKKTAMIGSDNQKLLEETYSLIGDAYHSMSMHQDSDEFYEKSLAINPKNALVLNNFAYYLSLRKEQLEKAAEMSKKSNELEANNSSFEDTYGWILYEQGKYEDAKIWLEKALNNGGNQRPVIVEHYGDILFKLNKIAEAKQQWQKAIELGGDKAVLNAKIEKK